MSDTITMSRSSLCDLLVKHGVLLNTTGEKIPHKKPGHGPCCTCQSCGYSHDECCCVHNDCLQDLERIAQ